MLSPNVLNLILKAAHQTPSADNSQPWRLEWQAPTLTVIYDTTRVCGKTFPADNPATLLTMGAMLENINQASISAACLATWEISDSLDVSTPVYFKAIFEQSNEKTDITINDSLALFKRHTNRFLYQSKTLPEALINALNNHTVNSARAVTINHPSTISQIADLVRQASEIRFQTQETHEWLAKSLRFDSTAAYDGLDVHTLDLPPGGTAFLRLISAWPRMKLLNFLGAYKVLSLIDSRPIKNAPTLVAIIAPSGFRDILAAGQLMNRIWIELNAQGFAVQPYYVIADQLHRRQEGVIPPGLEKQGTRIFNEAQQLFQLAEGETLQMLLRIGYPTMTPTLSKRLPLSFVYSK